MTPHEAIFEEFRQAYPGTKRGNEVEFDYFVECCGKTHKRRKLSWREELSRLLPALESETVERKTLPYLPSWKNLKTWLYNRCWTRDIIKAEQKEKVKAVAMPDCACGRRGVVYVDGEVKCRRCSFGRI